VEGGSGVETYGVWDLIYRYLLPGWWIIPIYVTVTAWIGTVSWWRRALRSGRVWARRLLEALNDAPTVRRYAVRSLLALPLFAPPAALAVAWYLVGCGIWAAFHDGVFRVAATPVSVGAAGYAVVAIVCAALIEDEESRLVVAFGFALVISVPLVLVGLLNLLLALLEVVTDLLFGTPEWSDVRTAALVTIAAIVPVVAFWVAGWTARKGAQILNGGDIAERQD
jgi:hypothetical protein